MTTIRLYEIINGPSLNELIEALRHGYKGKTVRLTVKTTDERGGNLILDVEITGLRRTDTDSRGANWLLCFRDPKNSLGELPLKVYFNTNVRQGYISPTQ